MSRIWLVLLFAAWAMAGSLVMAEEQKEFTDTQPGKSGDSGQATPGAAQEGPATERGFTRDAGMPTAMLSSGKIALRSDLAIFEKQAVDRLDETVEAIRNQSKDHETRAAASKWGRDLKSRLHHALQNKEPAGALLDAWALSQQALVYLTEGDGSEMFGESQPVAIAAMQSITDEIVSIAEQYLSSDKKEEARENINSYVTENPYKKANIFTRLLRHTGLFSVVDIGKKTVMSVASVPLAPGRAAKGLATGSARLGEINQTASRFTDVVQNLPTQLREESEKLLKSIADQQGTMTLLMSSVGKTADSVDKAADSIGSAATESNQLAKTATQLSSNVKETIQTAEQSAATFQQTAQAFGQMADQMRRLSVTAGDLVKDMRKQQGANKAQAEPGHKFDAREVTGAADAITSGAAQVTQMIDTIRTMNTENRAYRAKMEAEAEEEAAKGIPAQPPHHFDVREYQEAATAIDGGAARVTALLEQIHSMVRDDSMASATAQMRKEVAAALNQAAMQSRSVVNLIAIRVAELVLLIFVLLVLYQVLRARLIISKRS